MIDKYSQLSNDRAYTIRLPKQLVEDFKLECSKGGYSTSKVMRLLIIKWLNDKGIIEDEK